MVSKVSDSPPEADDLEALEDALRRIETVPHALWSPELKAEHAALAAEVERMLLELEALGRVKLARRADGAIVAAELLDRVRH
jgi:hypothetical protein